MRIRRTMRITAGAAGAALAVLALLAASTLPTMRLACLYLASLFCCPLACEGEVVYGFICFLAAGLCALLICPVKIYALLFVLFFGHYIQFQIFIARRIFSRAGRFLMKAAYCNIFAFITGFGIYLFMPQAFRNMTPTLWIGIIATLQVCFVILDRLNHSMLMFYHAHIQSKLFPR
jgi:hypothetical protein